MKKRSLNIFDAGIAFVVAFILAQFTTAIGISVTQTIMDTCGMSTAQISAFWDNAWGYLLQAIYMNIAFIIVFAWYYTRRNKPTMFTKPANATLKYVGVCILIGIATLFLLSGVLNYFQLILDKLNFDAGVLSYELNSPSTYIISLISLALIPAVCEELIFRGIIVNALKPKGHMFAIVLSSIMFAIFHFSPSQMIYPICFGLILSIVYLRTNNIIFPILLHFINNALSISIQYFSNDTTSTFTHSMSMLIYAIVTLLIWLYIIYRLFKDFKQHNLATSNPNSNIDNNQQHDIVTTSTTDTTQENDKLNHKVLYGSIIIMLMVYVLLMFM